MCQRRCFQEYDWLMGDARKPFVPRDLPELTGIGSPYSCAREWIILNA